MKKTRRKFSPEDRLSILKECERDGQRATCRKYNLAESMVQRWKAKYLNQGYEGLKPSYRKDDPELEALKKENERLRRIISNQALELEVKTEALKYAPVDYTKKKRS